MQLFYAPNITLPLFTLSEEESKHCVRVLRLGVGDTIHITNGAGDLFTAQIETASVKECIVRIVETRSEFEKRDYSLTMAVAPTKNMDRYEWFLEKATEAGVDRVVPILCEHSERKVVKHERCEKVVTSAVKQSLKAYMPQVDELTPFMQLVAEPFVGRKFIAHCESEGERLFLGDLITAGEDALVLIGPEGDFSPKEIAAARANGFQEITLGSCRLRTETAAVASVVMFSFVNNLSKK